MISSIKTGTLIFVTLLLFISAEVADVIHRSDLKYLLKTTALNGSVKAREKKGEESLNMLITHRENLDGILERIAKQTSSGEFSIVHYRNRQLQLWTDNRFTLPANLVEDIFRKPLVNLQGRWFVVNRISEGEDLFICLTGIWQEYKIDNEIVKSGFDRTFRMPEEAGFSTDSSVGYQVINRSGKYLFSVTYEKGEKFNTWFIFIPLLLWLLFIAGVIFLINRLNSYMVLIGYGFLTPLIALIISGLLYMVVVITGKPNLVTDMDIFSPYRFTLVKLIPSPGHVLLLCLAFGYGAWSFYRWFPVKFGKSGRRGKELLILSLYLSVSVLIFILYTDLVKSFITGSNINFEIHKVLDLDLFTVVAFVSSSLILIGLVMILLKILKSAHGLNNRVLFMAGGVSSIVIVVLLTARGENPFIHLLVWSALILTSRIFRDTTTGLINISVVFSLISGAHASYFIPSVNSDRETNNLKVLAVNYSADNDLYAESLLGEEWSVIQRDSVLSSMMNMRYFTDEEAGMIYGYLDRTYFSGYWENYERVYTICNYDSELIFEGSDVSTENCFGFFRSKMEQSVPLFNDSSLVFVENNSGRAYYLGSAFFDATGGTRNGLFIELVNKIKYVQTGYPELLIDNRYYMQPLLRKYSIGKYVSDTLVIQSGIFPFNSHLTVPNDRSREFVSFREDGTDYLLYNYSENVTLVIVRPALSLLDILVTFTYFFVGFFVLFFISLLFIHPPEMLSLKRLDFRQKMQSALIIILLGTMLAVGGVVIYLSVGQYREKHLENIKEKISSVNIELEHKLSGEKILPPNWSADGYPTLDDLLIKFSNVFYADINMFDSDGNLLASSRREVFDKELTGLRMNWFAINSLSSQGESQYIHQERIGELSFLSAYAPFYNSDKQLLAYLNLPYFNMQSKLTEEISNLVVAIINFSLILLVISMGFAVFISGRITSPLRMLREGMASVKLGEIGNQLRYKGEDEIGELVKQYNIMLRELHQSAIKLAISEREDAWREMAKQIAHEIKNPLTPMKLNVQQLDKSWKDGSGDFESRLARFTENQIEQIDNLSSIATEFSNFARMPKASPGKTNFINAVKNSTELFSDIRNIDLTLETNLISEVIIYADREQLSSMLTNLIRNAVQAIPSKRKGTISIEVGINRDKVLLSIADNGTGIPNELKEKLFAPNFTTKSSGMGLGLAIVKRIVETASGRIWFESNLSGGTTFYVEYPVISYKI